jgi:tetratricopeptide (TPR) repeat protein
MATPSAPFAIDVELLRIRELSTHGKHSEALAAAKTLAQAVPQNRDAAYLVAANLRCLNRFQEALATLREIEQSHPPFGLLYQEQGHCYTALRDAARAIDAFRRAVNLNSALTTSWIMLERLYRITGDSKSAVMAAQQIEVLSHLPPEVVKAGCFFSDGDLSAAESILRTYLRNAGSHLEASRMLGRIQHQRGALDEAEQLFESAVSLAPGYRAARLDYVRVLIDRQKYAQAREVIRAELDMKPGDREYLSLQAAACVGLGQQEEAIVLYRELIATSPDSPEIRVLLGHSLKSLGRLKEAIESYKVALCIRVDFGDAYWSLANLKTYSFSEDEIGSMRTAEAAASTSRVDRYHLCFALGKAYENRAEYAESWQFYEHGNQLKHAEGHYQAEIAEANTRKQIEVFSSQFFAQRAGVGAPYPDPIFVVGLPRSGSTLLEQILASHSQVEGTDELYDIQRIVLELQRNDLRYPEVLAQLAPQKFRELGERYIADTRPYRTGKPFFIDKMPNNFRHVGAIHLMLPNAKIIDMRREPMACCFSNLKQLFAAGQGFTYSIEDIASYYRNYLNLMRHWNAVLPGRVLRVCYEDLVNDLDASVRHILEFCGLKFETACLEFYKTGRTVHTPSSEQVRQPIFREGLDQWRKYEPWLGPLKEALGDALTHYRE